MHRTILVKLLVTSLAIICVGVGFIVGVVVKERTSQEKFNTVPSGAYNALFNVSPAGEIGFWIYSVRGSCPDLRTKDRRPLVLVASASYRGQGRIEFSELSACVELHMEGKREPQTVRCIDGFLNVIGTPNERERSGSYSVTFADGSQRSGDFLGIFCEPDAARSTR
jgi:hypothetical protein